LQGLEPQAPPDRVASEGADPDLQPQGRDPRQHGLHLRNRVAACAPQIRGGGGHQRRIGLDLPLQI